MSRPHTLKALRGRPNRCLPIGRHSEGPKVGQPRLRHVRTGSTVIVDPDDVEDLRAHLEAQGLQGDYTLTEQPPRRTLRRRRAKGARQVGTKAKAKAAKSTRRKAKAMPTGDMVDTSPAVE